MHLHLLAIFYIFNIYTCIVYAYSCGFMQLHVVLCMHRYYIFVFVYITYDNMHLHVLYMHDKCIFQILYAFACISYKSTCTTYFFTGIMYESSYLYYKYLYGLYMNLYALLLQ